MNLNDCKILICDDSILARKQIKDVVATIGEPAIFEASDGQSAIDIYKNEKYAKDMKVPLSHLKDTTLNHYYRILLYYPYYELKSNN